MKPLYLGEDVIFDVVGVMLNKEAQQLEDKAENLNFRSLLGNNTKMSNDLMFDVAGRGVTMSFHVRGFSREGSPVRCSCQSSLVTRRQCSRAGVR